MRGECIKHRNRERERATVRRAAVALENSCVLTLYSGFVLPIMSCLLIIYFVGTRHSQWHTWVHHYFYLSFRSPTLPSHNAQRSKFSHSIPLFANLRCSNATEQEVHIYWIVDEREENNISKKCIMNELEQSRRCFSAKMWKVRIKRQIFAKFRFFHSLA